MTASSRISKREERTDLPTDLIEGIEGLVDGGNEVINGITDFLQKPPGTPALDAPASDRNIPISPGPQNSKPGQLSVPGSNSDDSAAGSDSRSTTEGSDPKSPFATTTRFECDTSNNPCKEIVRYIIFPLGCDTVAGFGQIPCNVKYQNDATTAMLIRIVGDPDEIYISKDDDDGVFLWALRLSTREVEEVRSAKDKVRAVVPDRPIQPDQLLSESTSSLQDMVLESQLKKRLPFVNADDRVISQRNAPSHLCTISRAKNTGTKKTYDYFESAGQGITVYNIDSGANPQNKYIKIGRWIYGPSVINQRSDYANGGGHGSCTASLICGSLGVAKKAKVIAVKTALWMSDWLDSWQKIINDIGRRERRMEPVRGYNVVTCQISILDYDDEVKLALQKKLKTLFNIHQTVIVASSGNEGGAINSLPGILSTERDFPVITVGSVGEDGSTLSESQGGPALTVLAPGIVTCASSKPGDSTRVARGTSAASAQVAGVAATLLASRKYGAYLRSQDNIPSAVRDLVVDLAFAQRPDGGKVVSNGIETSEYP